MNYSHYLKALHLCWQLPLLVLLAALLLPLSLASLAYQILLRQLLKPLPVTHKRRKNLPI